MEITYSPKLTICISTFNRANLIGETLDSIVSQVTPDCEILVADNASPDDTPVIVQKYSAQCGVLRYVRLSSNDGLDRNYDRAVHLARGEYCWLMSDDDHLKPGAVAAVLDALSTEHSLVLVNAELVDSTMSRTILPRYCDVSSNQIYQPTEMDRLLRDLGRYATYVAGIIIKRSIWLERERERYYGTVLIHVGVIYQKPLPGTVVVIASPLIRFRFTAVHNWEAAMFEIGMILYPTLIWSLAASAATKRRIVPKEPWKSFWDLCLMRAYGFYSIVEYRRYVRPKIRMSAAAVGPFIAAVLPGALVNYVCTCWCLLSNGRYELEWLRASRFRRLNHD